MNEIRYLCLKCKRFSFFRFTHSINKVDDIFLAQLENILIEKDEKKDIKAATKLLWDGERERFNKTYDQKRAHVTSINPYTEQRSIVRLSLPQTVSKLPSFVKQSNLPDESLAGLKSSIADCKNHPKVIQNNADVLTRKLNMRRFPANQEEVRQARKLVMEQIKENDVQILTELKNPRSKEFVEKLIYNKAQKVLGTMRYNWKPLDVDSREEAAAFALAKLGSYYAEMEMVLAEFDRINYVPKTILDYGSGIGSAFWAANTKWGNKIEQYCLVDRNFHMRNFSMDIMRGFNYNGSGEFVNKNVYFRKNLLPSKQNKYDIVILHRTLIEMPSQEERIDLIDKLWERANKFLIIVESSMSESFKALMKIRDHILIAGHQFDFNLAKDILDKKGLLDMETIHFFANNKISDYEKHCFIKEKLSDENFVIPTKIDPGFIFAPCPHDQVCPKIRKLNGFISPCKFKVRWTEKRADHKTDSFMRDGTLTGKFSYVIFEKGDRPKTDKEFAPRILAKSKGHGCSTCTICTANDGLQSFTVSLRTKPIYGRIKGINAGQLLPVDYKIVKTSDGEYFDEVENDKLENNEMIKLSES